MAAKPQSTWMLVRSNVRNGHFERLFLSKIYIKVIKYKVEIEKISYSSIYYTIMTMNGQNIGIIGCNLSKLCQIQTLSVNDVIWYYSAFFLHLRQSGPLLITNNIHLFNIRDSFISFSPTPLFQSRPTSVVIRCYLWQS